MIHEDAINHPIHPSFGKMKKPVRDYISPKISFPNETKTVYECNASLNNALFKFDRIFINKSSEAIDVVLRNNLSVHNPAVQGSINNTREFVIRDVYTFRDNYNKTGIHDTISYIQNFKSKYNASNDELEIILKALIEVAQNRDRSGIVQIAIDHVINISELKLAKAIYINNLDVLLVYEGNRLQYPHPFSSEGGMIDQYYDLVKNRHVSGVFVEFIDNESMYSERYMYAGGRVIKVPPRQDPYRESGVYFTVASNTAVGDVHIEPIRCTVDEAEKNIGLYKNREQAISSGNPGALLELELEELKHNNGVLKHENEKIKAIAERERSEIERLTQEVKKVNIQEERELTEVKVKSEKRKTKRTDKSDSKKHKNEKQSIERKANFEYQEYLRKQKMAEIEDHYERKSFDRKDSHEIWKTVAVVGSVGLSIYAMINKSK